MRRSSRLLLIALLATPAWTPLLAQDPVTPPAQVLVPDSAPQAPRIVSPRGAFLRAIAVPGWGHASIAEHTRGGFYFLTETAAAWMVVRTRLRLNAAKDVHELRLADVRARLRATGVTDPAEIANALQNDPGVIAARSLVDARSQQFEDWLVFGIFFVFLSGADAFVSAHLKDFPEPVGVGLDGEGALELRLSIPLRGRPAR